LCIIKWAKGDAKAMRKISEEDFIDQGEQPPEVQAQALDDAWKRAVENAKKDPGPCRFRRGAAVLDPKQDRRIHFCAKRRSRVHFAICWNENCGHFHPLLPVGDGSCDFKPKKKRDAEKIQEGRKKEREETADEKESDGDRD
jgi:hypothetical protein